MAQSSARITSLARRDETVMLEVFASPPLLVRAFEPTSRAILWLKAIIESAVVDFLSDDDGFLYCKSPHFAPLKIACFPVTPASSTT
jgi:hypothetical protein